MNAIFRQALGADFERLHPEMRRRFGVSAAGAACVGTGVMDRIWHGGPHLLPFLWLGASRHILFPERGTDVPFTIENYGYRDRFGRETVTFVRTFEMRRARRRRFDATMVYDPARGGIVDFLGTHQHLAVDLQVSVDATGGLHIRSGEQRLTEGPVRCRVPAGLSGTATLHEWYDEKAACFRIDVRVTNRRFGPIFGYTGSFTTRYPQTPLPAAVLPLRENPDA